MADPVKIDPRRKPDAVLIHRNARKGPGDAVDKTRSIQAQAMALMGLATPAEICYTKQFSDQWYFFRPIIAGGMEQHTLCFPKGHAMDNPTDCSRYIHVQKDACVILMYLKDEAIQLHQETLDAHAGDPVVPFAITGVHLAGQNDA